MPPMATQLDHCLLMLGSVDARDFTRECEPGDWQHVTINLPLSVDPDSVTIIANAWSPEAAEAWEPNFPAPGRQIAYPVPIITDVRHHSFQLHLRNSAPVPGRSGAFWLAVVENPEFIRGGFADVRFGVCPPETAPFAAFEEGPRLVGLSHSVPRIPWPPDVEPDFKPQAVFFTATDVGLVHAAPVAVMATLSNPNTKQLASYTDQFEFNFFNTDCNPGWVSLYYLWIRPSPAPVPDVSNVMIDSGLVGPGPFARACQDGDWYHWNVQFRKPFSSPPMLFFTATDKWVDSEGLDYARHGVPALGVAQKVHPNGFHLSARNTDCTDGRASFYWLAIGCGPGCG